MIEAVVSSAHTMSDEMAGQPMMHRWVFDSFVTRCSVSFKPSRQYALCSDVNMKWMGGCLCACSHVDDVQICNQSENAVRPTGK